MRGLEGRVLFFVPGRRAREGEADGHAGEGEPAERAREDGGAVRGCEEEEEGGDYGWRAEVADAVGEPGEEVEDGVGVR